MAMLVPEPLVSPEDDGKDARPPIGRVSQGLSAANRKLLEFFRKTVRVEIGEGLRPVLAVVDSELSWEPLDVLWLLHFGALTVHVDLFDRVYLVKTDVTDVLCGVAPPKRPKVSVKAITGQASRSSRTPRET